MLNDKISQITHEESEFERCVLCWKLTDVRKDTPIGKRNYYVERAGGQLHPKCYMEVYSEGTKRIEETRARLWLDEMGIILN